MRSVSVLLDFHCCIVRLSLPQISEDTAKNHLNSEQSYRFCFFLLFLRKPTLAKVKSLTWSHEVLLGLDLWGLPLSMPWPLFLVPFLWPH